MQNIAANAAQTLDQLRAHHQHIFDAIDSHNIMALQRAPIGAQDDDLEYLIWMDVWDYSILRDAAWAMHDLALRTPASILANVWEMAAQLHSEPAICMLAPRLKREMAPDSMLLPLIECGEDKCNKCKALQFNVLQRLKDVPMNQEKNYLDDDFAAIRQLLNDAKRRKILGIALPRIATSAKTAVAFSEMRSRARRLSSLLAAATAARLMWRAWLERQLAPGSRCILKVQRRWNTLAGVDEAMT